jgi:hypothetical protein
MILTLAEAKNLLGLTDTSLDSRLTAILPIVESDCYIITKNDFMVKEYEITSITSGLINVVNDLAVGDTVMIYSGENGQEPMTVLTASGTQIAIANESLVDEGANSLIKMKYPKGLKLVAAKMAKYKIEDSPGIKSESLSQYSVTYDTNVEGYPQSIINDLRRYSKYFKRSE